MPWRYAALLVALLPVTLTGAQPPSWRIRDAPAAMRPVIARADLVIASLQDAVLRELNDTYAAGGADVAIRTCHIDTTLTTFRFAREGIAAGRTSDRLRSPSNRAPKWAAETVAAWAGHAAREIDGFAFDLGDRVGVLRPIAQRERCLECHGPVERLSPTVRATLADRYPVDRAIGFREGDIRGWFWVEMPKPSRKH
jgi:hypothetical protein